MEKSRAIELLKLAVPIKALTQQEYADFVEAVNMGMDALEQPTSPDTIDRQAVIKVLECWQKAFKENSHHASASDLSLVVKDIRALSATQPVATDANVGDKISKFIDGLEEIFAYIREREGGDSVCGLCEYDGAYIGESGDWCNECPGFNRDDCFKLSDKTRKKWTEEIIKALPTVQPEERTEKRMETHGACLDAISRQAAIDALDCINGTEEVLRSLPTVQPERKKGEWIEISSINHTYKCSECGRLLVNVTDGKNNVSKHYPYCHCGAYMGGEQDG